MFLNRMTRRAALGVLGAAVAPRVRGQAGSSGILRAVRVDHVALEVGNLDKELAFYRRLFGNDVLKNKTTPRRYLRLGPCYLAIAPAASGQMPRIDHFAVAIEKYDAAAMKTALQGAGIAVRETDAGLFVADPDGNSIQVGPDQSWKQLSQAAPEKYPNEPALFRATGMHHMAIQVSDTAKAVGFYSKLFGKAIEEPPGSPQPLFMAGETRLRIYPPGPNKSPRIDHFSALVEPFNAASALQVVKSLGARAELSKDGALNEFYDPDGIRMQVTIPGQTYGPPTKK